MTAHALIYRLNNPVRYIRRSSHFGLGVYVFDKHFRAPVGWVVVGEYHRRGGVMLPFWLGALVMLRRDWQRLVFGSLMRLGVWEIAEGGFYMQDGRPRIPSPLWCFLNDSDGR